MWKLKTFSHLFECRVWISISAEGWVLRLSKHCGKKPIEYLRWDMMGLIHHSTRISTEISPINKINTYFFRLKPVGGKMKIASIAISAQHAFIRILKVFFYIHWFIILNSIFRRLLFENIVFDYRSAKNVHQLIIEYITFY